jgi:hypothetical protein
VSALNNLGDARGIAKTKSPHTQPEFISTAFGVHVHEPVGIIMALGDRRTWRSWCALTVDCWRCGASAVDGSLLVFLGGWAIVHVIAALFGKRDNMCNYPRDISTFRGQLF